MLCINCGSNNAPDNRYCGQCGARLPEPPAPVATAPVPEETASRATVVRPTTSVSTAFRHDIEQQEMELQRFQSAPPAEPNRLQWAEVPVTEVAPIDSVRPQQQPNDLQADSRQGVTRVDRAPYPEQPANTPADTSVAENVAETPVYDPQDAISGPSFLGLNDDGPAADSRLDYLYEDDPPSHGRARYWIAALIAVGFIGFVVYEMKQNWNWDTTIIGRHRQQQTANANPSDTSAGAAGPNAAAAAQKPTSAPPASVTVPPNQAGNSTRESAGPNSGADTSNSGTNEARPDGNAARTAGTSTPAAAGVGALAAATPPASTGATPPKNDSSAQNLTPATPPAAAGKADTSTGPNTAADNGTPGSNLKNQAKTGKWPPAAQGSDLQQDDAGDHPDDTVVQADAPAKPTKLARGGAHSRSRLETTKDATYSGDQPDQALVTKADAYLYGRGVPKNCDQALVYLRTAANRGNASARSKLGGLYATGHCVPLDRAEAYTWFTLAHEAGSKNVWIERNREMLWSEMSADEKARAKQ